MGVSTDGILAFGIQFDPEEEDIKLPWMVTSEDEDDDEQDEIDLEEWWRRVNGYKPSKEIWTEEGKLPGVTEADLEAYYQEQSDWDSSHPMPFSLQTHCSGEYSQYILAVPGTVTTANRGAAQEITSLEVPTKALAKFKEFCAKYGVEGEPKWWLCSYWGS